MANLGYIQVTRACNQACRFCSNPPSGQELDLAEARRRIDDLAGRGYGGVIFTGGEPTLVPWLAEAVRYASARGLPPRVISNGQRLAAGGLLDELVAAGLRHLHLSMYSERPEIHDALTENPGSHQRLCTALERAGERPGLAVDLNCVINARNADGLDRVVALVVRRFPFVRHLVFNNLDARMNRVSEHPETVPRLRDLELSLVRALRLAEAHGLTFRVERVPLCYMAEWAHCSTETRKLVKDEERIVHFLDAKGMVRQEARAFVHAKAAACQACLLDPICAGLDGLGQQHDGADLYPVFLDPRRVIARVLAEDRGVP